MAMSALEDEILDALALARKMSREEVAGEMRAWVLENPPRRFAICSYYDDAFGHDGELLAWGLAFDDHVIAQAPGRHLHGSFSTAESMLAIMGGPDAEVVWIDEVR